MAHQTRRDPAYTRGLPKPVEHPAYLTDFQNYDSTLLDPQNLTPVQEDAVIGTLDDRNKARLRDLTDALTADFLLAGGAISYWPAHHRTLSSKQAQTVETVALGVGHNAEHPLPSRYTFKQPRRIRRFALRRG